MPQRNFLVGNETGYQVEELKEYEITQTEKGFCITNLNMGIKTRPLFKWVVEYDANGIIAKVLKNDAENGYYNT